MRQMVAVLIVLSLSVNITLSAEKTKQEKRKETKQVVQLAEQYNQLVVQKRWKEAAAVVDQARKTAPNHPVVTLMQRHYKAVPREQDQTPYRTHGGIVGTPQTDPGFLVVTYAVADLVIPIPKSINVTNDVAAKAAKTPAPDYDSLIQLIKETLPPVDPEGADAISYQPYPSTLSLVVRHTPECHEQIADLLQQLRRLQEVQVTLEFRFVNVSELLAQNLKLPPHRTGTLSHAQTQLLLHQLQSDARSNILQAPKVTIFNGQAVDIHHSELTGPLQSILANALVSADRRKIRMALALNCQDRVDVLASLKTRELMDGDSWVIDITPTVGSRVEVRTEVGVPVLDNIPYVNRLFKNTGIVMEDRAHLLLITPRIIIQEEEEELLFQSRVNR